MVNFMFSTIIHTFTHMLLRHNNMHAHLYLGVLLFHKGCSACTDDLHFITDN